MEIAMAVTPKVPLKKRTLTFILICGVILLLILAGKSVLGVKAGYDLETTEGRVAYLSSLGWEADPETESFRTVVVPQQLEGIMAQYNKMQLKQGFDLNKHLGQSCRQYCYDIKNYGDADGRVIASLYIQDGILIAGDIHSTAVNGFMHGLTRETAE